MPMWKLDYKNSDIQFWEFQVNGSSSDIDLPIFHCVPLVQQMQKLGCWSHLAR
jgi:hypothetical protein